MIALGAPRFNPALVVRKPADAKMPAPAVKTDLPAMVRPAKAQASAHHVNPALRIAAIAGGAILGAAVVGTAGGFACAGVAALIGLGTGAIGIGMIGLCVGAVVGAVGGGWSAIKWPSR